MNQFNASVLQIIWKKFFRFCTKVKILWPQLLFFEDAYWKYVLAYSKPHNFKILRNKMNEKAGFEITADVRKSKNNQHDNNQLIKIE